MNLLKRLTLKNLRLNKKHTAMTILGISLSVALITSVFTMLASMRTSLINYEINTDGDAHYFFSDVPAEEMKSFANNRSIEKWFYTQGIGFAKIEESQNEYKPYAYLLSADSEAMNGLALHLITGRLPQTEEEIAIPRHLKTNGRVEYHVGDSLTLDVGQRYDEDGNMQTQNTALLDNETLTTEFQKTYKVVGIIERPNYRVEDYSGAGYTFLTWKERQEQDWDGLYSVYAKYTKKALRNHYKVTANLLGVDEDFFEKTKGGTMWQDEWGNLELLDEGMKDAKFTSSNNATLISLENFNLGTFSIDDNDGNGLLRIFSFAAVIALLLIVLSSVFCIRNSFEISITEKIRQYGMIASVGATKKQIRKNVLYEAFVLGIVGTPIGIILGLSASVLLVKIADILLQDAIDGVAMQFNFSLATICGAVLLGALTIYLSAARAARRASRISPIAAIRSNDDIRIRAKGLKSPKSIKKLFGMGGEISYKNMKRNRKKYRTIVTSIVICVSVFIALASFVQFTFGIVGLSYPVKDYNLDISIYTQRAINKQEKKTLEASIQEICGLEESERYSVKQSFTYTLPSPKLTDEAKELIPFFDDEGNPTGPPETLDLELLSLGDEEYRRYIKRVGLSYEQAERKGILLNSSIEYIRTDDNVKKVSVELYDYKKGDTLKGTTGKYSEGKNKHKEMELTLAAITDKLPMGLEAANNYGYLIISDALMEEVLAQYPKDTTDYRIHIKSSNPDMQQDKIEAILWEQFDPLACGEFHTLNLDAAMREEQSLFLLIAIFLYGFIIVIALIGITSIFNTITASMNLRSREFAMLRSVGMTKKEFNRMVGLESIFYGIKSLVIAVPLGLLLSFLIYCSLQNEILEVPYIPPVGALLISILAVFLLLVCIMRYSLHRINQQEIIETIRKDMV